MDEEKSTDPMAIVIAVFSGITLIIDIPPLIWHLKNRNIAACCLISWIVLLNFFAFINAIIWSTDDVNKWFDGQWLCDIQVKLFVGATIAIPLALLRIIRSLALVLCTKGGTGLSTAKERRKRFTIDLITCLLIPALFMILHYIVQPNRYYIWRVSGCQVSIDNSWVSVVILLIWPLLITLIDSYYAGLVIYRLRCYRKELHSLLETSHTTKSRFYRLFLLSFLLIVAFLPTQIYILAVNLVHHYQPYTWARVHGDNWNTVILLPGKGNVPFDRWVRIAGGFLIFLFFGVGTDAVTLYKSWLLKIIGYARNTRKVLVTTYATVGNKAKHISPNLAQK